MIELCDYNKKQNFIGTKQLDVWRHKKNFQTILRDALIRQKALDRIMVGFNSTSRAAKSNCTANPLLQDVNKGGLQKY